MRKHLNLIKNQLNYNNNYNKIKRFYQIINKKNNSLYLHPTPVSDKITFKSKIIIIIIILIIILIIKV